MHACHSPDLFTHNSDPFVVLNWEICSRQFFFFHNYQPNLLYLMYIKDDVSDGFM
jgi:hypothetical protein